MTLERFGGMLECLRGLPGLKKQEYVFITHNKMNINIYVDKLGKKIVNLSIPKEKLISLDLLEQENLEQKCEELIQGNIPGEMLFGSARYFMLEKWPSKYRENEAMVKCMLCVSYYG